MPLPQESLKHSTRLHWPVTPRRARAPPQAADKRSMRSDDANHDAKFADPFRPVGQFEKRVESHQRSSGEALSPRPPKRQLSRPYSFTDHCFVLPDDTKRWAARHFVIDTEFESGGKT